MKTSRSSFIAAFTTLSMASMLLVSSQASATSTCNSFAQMGSQIYARYGESWKANNCKKGEGVKCAKWEQVVKDMTSFWNKMSANGWATLGPREIVFEGRIDGKVVAGGERLFVTKMPVEDADTVKIKIIKEGGKAPTKIRVATMDESERCIEGKEVTFAGDDKKNTTKELSMSGIRGRLVFIKVDAKDLKAFDYELEVRKE